MQSGLADFDVKGFDDALLKQGTSVHSPLEFLLLGTGRSTPIRLLFILMWLFFNLPKFLQQVGNRLNLAELVEDVFTT